MSLSWPWGNNSWFFFFSKFKCLLIHPTHYFLLGRAGCIHIMTGRLFEYVHFFLGMLEELKYRHALGHFFGPCWNRQESCTIWNTKCMRGRWLGRLISERQVVSCPLRDPRAQPHHGGRHGHSLQELEQWRGLGLEREVLPKAVSLQAGHSVLLSNACLGAQTGTRQQVNIFL